MPQVLGHVVAHEHPHRQPFLHCVHIWCLCHVLHRKWHENRSECCDSRDAPLLHGGADESRSRVHVVRGETQVGLERWPPGEAQSAGEPPVAHDRAFHLVHNRLTDEDARRAGSVEEAGDGGAVLVHPPHRHVRVGTVKQTVVVEDLARKAPVDICSAHSKVILKHPSHILEGEVAGLVRTAHGKGRLVDGERLVPRLNPTKHLLRALDGIREPPPPEGANAPLSTVVCCVEMRLDTGAEGRARGAKAR
mmetsp:Transcript_9879/g.29131  ORF Transcript_9879/g.29131 Transcript_9879/m.29131 type:complete len:249 (+) Transcript_9879:127-873(+)